MPKDTERKEGEIAFMSFKILTEFGLVSMIVRLTLAAAAGGIIGYGRSKRKQNAGLRTYMLTSIGAALTIMISLYEYQMLLGQWADVVEIVGMKFDGSRIAAAVISGIGFLAAGTILSADHQQTTGLTTAAGLFASVCMGICAGAGFYECVIISLIMLVLVLDVMAPLEIRYKRRIRNITIYVEFEDIDDIGLITDIIKKRNATVYDIEVERTVKEGDKLPSALFTLRLGKEHPSHSGMLSSIAELDCVNAILEIFA